MSDAPTVTPESKSSDGEYDEISLMDIFVKVWIRRGPILFSAVILAIVLFGGAFLYFAAMPRSKTVDMEFSVLFDGSSQGQFPNGTSFNPHEIIASTILREVYEKNNLDRYLPFSGKKDEPDFLGAVSLVPTGRSELFLRLEYEARLSNEKLSLPERRELEERYESQRELLHPTSFVLSFSGREDIPDEVVKIALADILPVWAENLERTKGINRYALTLRSVTESPSSAEFDSHIVAADHLALRLVLFEDDLKTIANLPGARAHRLDDGTTLYAIEERLDYLVRHYLRPLQLLLAENHLQGEVRFERPYFQARKSLMQRKQHALMRMRDAKREALSLYDDRRQTKIVDDTSDFLGSPPREYGSPGGLISVEPGPDFFNMVLRIAEEAGGAIFRQELINKMLAVEEEIATLNERLETINEIYPQEMQDGSAIPPAERARLDEFVSRRFAMIESEVPEIAKMMQTFLESLTLQNFDVRTQLYRIATSPAIHVHYPTPFSRVMLVAMAAWVLLVGIVVMLIFVSDIFHQSSDDRVRMSIFARLLPDLRRIVQNDAPDRKEPPHS